MNIIKIYDSIDKDFGLLFRKLIFPLLKFLFLDPNDPCISTIRTQIKSIHVKFKDGLWTHRGHHQKTIFYMTNQDPKLCLYMSPGVPSKIPNKIFQNL